MVLESAELPQTPCCHFSLRLLEKNWKLSKKSLVCQLAQLLQTTYLDSCALVACHDLTFLKRKSVTQSPFICSFLDVLGFCLACSLAFLSRELSECALHLSLQDCCLVCPNGISDHKRSSCPICTEERDL